MQRTKPTKLPAPFLKKLTLRQETMQEIMQENKGYPFDLPWLQIPDFQLNFTTAVTIIVGENGSGKSTLVEAIAALSGYDEAGGGKGYAPVDHSQAVDKSGSDLAKAFRAAWLPKVTRGWFFKAESFFSVARYLDEAAIEAMQAPPDFLSASHGEGFVRFFHERMARQGIYFMDEPESALSPNRQLDLLRVLNTIQQSAVSQVIMATHSPILMAVPNATILHVTHRGFEKIDLRQTQHFKMYQDFTVDPDEFVKNALRKGDDND